MRYFLLILILLSKFSYAEVFEELDRYSNCYKHFVGEPLKGDDDLVNQIRASSLSGAQACKKLLDLVIIEDSSGMIVDNSNKEIAIKIITSFNNIHKGFFYDYNYDNYSHGNRNGKYLADENERSYYLLNALFRRTQDGDSTYDFGDIFTDPITYKAVRDASNKRDFKHHHLTVWLAGSFFAIPNYYTIGYNNKNFVESPEVKFSYAEIHPEVFEFGNISTSSGKLLLTGSNTLLRNEEKLFDIGRWRLGYDDHFAHTIVKDFDVAPENLTELGEIEGLTAKQPLRLDYVFTRLADDSDGYVRNYTGPAYQQPYPSVKNNLFDNLEAGILFPPTFQPGFALDTDNVFVQNGVNQMPREWPENFLKNFLCRTAPVIRAQDAAVHITPNPSASAPFRAGTGCMRCHATLDHLASISRNYQNITTSPVSGQTENSFKVNHFYSPTFPAIDGYPEEPDPFFYVRPGDGYFRFRDFSGNYHNVELKASINDPNGGFKELASYLKTMDDPYACMVSKYFSHFTGHEVKFFDPGDPEAPALTKKDQAIQKYVIDLGRKLKLNGDLLTIIKEIISSEIYIDPQTDNIPVVSN